MYALFAQKPSIIIRDKDKVPVVNSILPYIST